MGQIPKFSFIDQYFYAVFPRIFFGQSDISAISNVLITNSFCIDAHNNS